MIKIINGIIDIDKVYIDNQFNMNKWNDYIKEITPHGDIFIDDMNEVIGSGNYTYERDFLPVLNGVINKKNKIEETINSFIEVTSNLNQRIIDEFRNGINANIILYLGLCNGAGWVMELDREQYIFLGIEKIIELNWCDVDSMYGLIYHELGHIYQMQYGILERDFSANKDTFLWQLFTEGIAMCFEQRLVGNEMYFHQNQKGWLDWCNNNFEKIRNDFTNDLSLMTRSNQKYFGDWVRYNGHGDVGYYLGSRFVWYISKLYSLDEMVNFEIDTVSSLYYDFVNSGLMS